MKHDISKISPSPVGNPSAYNSLFFSVPAYAKYSGGMGEPNNPYQIATAEDLILLGETPEDYDKPFILTTDIDLAPNLPGRKVFDRAVIAPNMNEAMNSWGGFEFDGTQFTGVFDGNEHTISHLTCCYSSGIVTAFGQWTGPISGLIGMNRGDVTACYSISVVRGGCGVGGLVGENVRNVTCCYSTGTVSGYSDVGGLVGRNFRGAARSDGTITECYSSSITTGDAFVGGLVGSNNGSINSSYSSGLVSGTEGVGGLVGSNVIGILPEPEGVAGIVTHCFWDIETSGQATSEGGTGKTTSERQMAGTFLEAGWDFVDETKNGTDDIWRILEGRDYPRLWWEPTPEK